MKKNFSLLSFFCLIPFLQEAGSIMRKQKARIRTSHVQLRIHYLSITLTYR